MAKMDIEGAEFTVLPSLENHGLLCASSGGIKDITIEYHPRSKEWKIPASRNSRLQGKGGCGVSPLFTTSQFVKRNGLIVSTLIN